VESFLSAVLIRGVRGKRGLDTLPKGDTTTPTDVRENDLDDRSGWIQQQRRKQLSREEATDPPARHSPYPLRRPSRETPAHAIIADSRSRRSAVA
jgi:hypothetical protein